MDSYKLIKWLAQDCMSISVSDGTMTIEYNDRGDEKTVEVDVMGEREAIVNLESALEDILGS